MKKYADLNVPTNILVEKSSVSAIINDYYKKWNRHETYGKFFSFDNHQSVKRQIQWSPAFKEPFIRNADTEFLLKQ